VGIVPPFFVSTMNETDYRSLILVYQQKSSDLFSQTVALEAKVMVANQTIEALKKKTAEQEDELNKLKTRKKSTQKTDNLSAEEF
jgi:uncharacterized protein YqcC (DUF446 family)